MGKEFKFLTLTLLFFIALISDALSTTADHTTFDILKQKFATGPDVTKACLTCHTESAKQVHKTIHWTWVCPKSFNPKLGKTIVINNFCVALQSNEPRCTSCHAGYGWKDKNFDFTSEQNVDCLVCHDQTGEYKKFPTAAGHPTYEPKQFMGKTWYPPDLTKIAQNVGRPNRHNCGVCHFYGGGGEGVKHADLDMSLENPTWSLDVHMDREGLNYVCTDCHTTRDHEIAGRCYSVPAPKDRFELPLKSELNITCESCHSDAPHKTNAKLNDHADVVSCQACHIPRAARKKPTKFWWDWSKAGQFDENGKPIVTKDKQGNVIYDTKKGEFRWDKNTLPDYYWFNGSASNIIITDFIDPTKVVQINALHGDKDDPDSRIWPVKVHRGKQPYDPVNKTLVIPKLFGKKGTGAYWADYDWVKSAKAGMEYVDLPFSGEVDFIETAMYWQITHMVAPAKDAVQCQECHRKEGRLASLTGFYMPGRDHFGFLDTLGLIAVILALVGVIGHGTLRITGNRRKENDNQAEDGGEA